MPPTPPDPPRFSLEAEIHALREENAALRDASREAGALSRDAARYHRSQARFRAVFEHSPLGQKIIGPDLLIRQANPAVVALLGLPGPEALLGRPIMEFAHPDHRADWRALQHALWARSVPAFALETRLQRPNGTELWCRVTSVLFPDEDGPLGYTTLEDITARKALEAGLRETAQHRSETAHQESLALNEELAATNEALQAANARLEHSHAELDTFVYAASHDLRSPLANLQGLVQALAEEGLAPATGGPAPPLLGMMRASLARLGGALDRLAEFGNAGLDRAGGREKLSLAAALEAVRAEVAPQLAATGGRLEVDLAGDPTLWFAPLHLHSVLLNLVSNALKYRHSDRAPVVRVRSYRDAFRLVVRVQDNGRGLSEAQQGQLFHMFRRFHPDVEGTGVGLYLVKKILAHVGASVKVKSQAGHGSTFTLIFPT